MSPEYCLVCLLAARAAAAGLFSVVTTGRLELVLEELHQAPEQPPQWREICFPYKPGKALCSVSFQVSPFRCLL